jgi:hyperosmotically inducible protein
MFGTPLAIYTVTLLPTTLAQILRKTGVTRMKKFAIAAATATALTLTMANVAMAQTSTQAPMVVAAGEVAKTKEATSDTWITTKVKSDLLTEKGIPGSDIKVETNKGVVSLSSTVAITEAQKNTAVAITKKIKGVKAVSADGLKAE